MSNGNKELLEKNHTILRNNYFQAYTAYTICFKLSHTINIQEVGKENAEKNVKIMNDYSLFFNTIISSTRSYMFINLAKIFDKDKDSITINGIINFITSTKNDISKEEKEKCRILLDDCIDIQDKIKRYRNKQLVHEDKINENIPWNENEIKTIFESLNIIMNAISYVIDKSLYLYNHLDDTADREINSIIQKITNS